MAKHDITSRDSPVVVYVSDNEVYIHPCSMGHSYLQADDGAPIECGVCGAPFPYGKKDPEVLRAEIWGRIRERLQSGEYGYA